MGGELVTGSPPQSGTDGGPVVRYGERFEALCGRYMSMGMSYHDYWDGDCQMAKYYREAEERRLERENTKAWLHGLYIYKAILDTSPVLNILSKRKTPHKYLDAPVPLTEQASRRAKADENRQKMNKGISVMQAMMAGINARFLKKGGGNDGG